MLVAMTSLDVAFVAAIAGVVGASGGILSAIAVLWLAPKSMRQQKELARAERLHAELRSSYADCLYNMYALNDAVRETQLRRLEEVQGRPPASVQAFVQPEAIIAWRRAGARVSVIASEGVAKAMNDAVETAGEFWGRLGTVETTALPQPDQELERLRAEVDARVEDLERLMRLDVRG